jgi:hypothetical protein
MLYTQQTGLTDKSHPHRGLHGFHDADKQRKAKSMAEDVARAKKLRSYYAGSRKK